MPGVDYELSQHARDVLEERELPVAWLERVLSAPQRIEPDPDDGNKGGRVASHMS